MRLMRILFENFFIPMTYSKNCTISDIFNLFIEKKINKEYCWNNFFTSKIFCFWHVESKAPSTLYYEISYISRFNSCNQFLIFFVRSYMIQMTIFLLNLYVYRKLQNLTQDFFCVLHKDTKSHFKEEIIINKHWL